MIRRDGRLVCPGCKSCELTLLDGGRVQVTNGRIMHLTGNPSQLRELRHLHGNHVLRCRLCGWRTTVARARREL